MALPLIASAVLGATVYAKPSNRLTVLTVGLLVMGLSYRGSVQARLQMRMETYQATLIASMEHPWVGQGQNPLAEPIMLQERNAPLPSIHSSWLSLLFHHGIVAVTLVALGVFQAAARTKSRLCRGAIAGISALGVADDILRWPGLLAFGVWVLIMTYREARNA